MLLQNTPKQEQKLKEFFTLPAVKLLLDWFKLNPVHLHNPILKASRYVYSLIITLLSIAKECNEFIIEKGQTKETFLFLFL